MFRALTRNSSETCAGYWYEKYPTLENSTKGEFFRFELLADETIDSTHLVENLKAEDERIAIRTEFRHDFQADQYIAAFGELYKIERVNRTRIILRGVAVPRVLYTLHLIRCAANPLGL